MRKEVRICFLGLSALLLAPVAVAAQSLEGKVIEHRLKNGLTLLMYERHQAPIVSCRTFVNVGSANDRLGETGIAHMTEHIAFKGSKTIGTTDYVQEKVHLDRLHELWRAFNHEREKGRNADAERLAQLQEEIRETQKKADAFVVSEAYSKILEEHGGIGLNASTSRDSTQYFVDLPANRLELWMLLEADRLMNIVPREFYKERDVVMEERRMRTDASPIGTLIEQFLGTAFIAHPYGLPAIGWASDIEGLTVEELEAFYRRYYSPSNMTVALVGSIQPDAVILMAEKYFGQIPSGPPAPRIHTVEPPQVGERRVKVEWDSNPYILLGYHRPDVRHEDDPVFDVISFLLSTGRTSQLYKHLVEEQQLAAYVSTSANFAGQKYPNLFFFVGVPLAPHTLEELEEALYEEIELLKRRPVDERELQKVINNMEAEFIDSLSSNSGLAEQLVFAQGIMGDWRAIEEQMERMKTITAADVMRVANKYFTERNRTVAWLVKKK
ncbi:peptidase M16 [candidate division KSB3 bacterium]|uniref:Peptidase M16 n=1 Tax=candidate division KSB3 bacterium TaxID=2044937 RepID=A0A2G6E3H9_9BACT|nr:MAG: peptidase M16 [candidate division KSB3 bacterium]PIE29168.1 MAG: peptidase M16 [candidate division KSB3 bacterium]